MTELIKLVVDGSCAEIILNKPARRNALCQKMWKALPQMIGEAVRDEQVSVIIIHGGNTGAFAAGADISEFAEIYETQEKATAASAAMADAVAAVENCEKPIVAAIEGACIGGGVSIAAACDLRFAEHGSKFAVTPGKLGLLYSPADTRRLIAVVGHAAAKDLLLSGRLITFEEAQAIRLINHPTPEGGALRAAKTWAEQVGHLSQASVRATKEMFRGLENGWQDHTPEAIDLFLNALISRDFEEGYRAFLEKRAPQFPGNGPSKPGGRSG
ncbi:MAG: enoyl-CoA hydratase-related protein [Pseudomonadota bacterium]